MNVHFNKLVDYFIHPRLKVDKSLYEKSRVSALAFISVLTIMPAYSIYYIFEGHISDLKAFHNYLGIFISFVGLLIIKLTGKTDLALSFVGSVGVYLVTFSVYMAGGIQSNDILWYLVLSSASFMFINIRTGFIISFLCFVGMTIFYFQEVYHFIPMPAEPISMSPAYRYFNFLNILVILSVMVFILVRGNNKLQVVIQQTKEQRMREEIARDFHDQIGNKLASLRHLAELVRMNKTNVAQQDEIISKIDEKAKDVYDNFRDFIWTLDAKSDQLIELFMYLRDFIDDHFKYSEVNLFISSVPDELPEITLPSYYSKEIVPLFKEAITNIHRHANAKNVHFEFIVSKKELLIRLKDDGIGMESTDPKNGRGLTNMNHRAKLTGGTISIASIPTKGTEVVYTVLLPI